MRRLSGCCVFPSLDMDLTPRKKVDRTRGLTNYQTTTFPANLMEVGQHKVANQPDAVWVAAREIRPQAGADAKPVRETTIFLPEQVARISSP